MYASLTLFFDDDQFCDSQIIIFYHTQQKPLFSVSIFHIAAPALVHDAATSSEAAWHL